MATINNYGSKIGRQVGNPDWFNNVDCTIGEQVVNNSNGGKKQKEEKDWKDFEKRMRELAERMRDLKKSGRL